MQDSTESPSQGKHGNYHYYLFFKLSYLTFVQSVNEFIEETIRRMLPGEFTERQKVYEEEMADMIGASDDGKNTIPGNTAINSRPTLKISFLSIQIIQNTRKIVNQK